MSAIYEWSLIAAAVGSGVIAGLCFTFQSFVLASFDGLGARDAIRAMQSVNRVILRSSAMLVWLGTAAVGIAAVALAEAPLLVGGALGCYLAGALLITRLGNIPLNDELETVDPNSADAAAAWERYRRLWARWNGLRTAACALACAGFALAH